MIIYTYILFLLLLPLFHLLLLLLLPLLLNKIEYSVLILRFLVFQDSEFVVLRQTLVSSDLRGQHQSLHLFLSHVIRERHRDGRHGMGSGCIVRVSTTGSSSEVSRVGRSNYRVVREGLYCATAVRVLQLCLSQELLKSLLAVQVVTGVRNSGDKWRGW